MQNLDIKEWKLFELQITHYEHPRSGVDVIMSIKAQHSQKYNKILSNVHKIEGAHLQWVNNHYAKFEYKRMKTVGVTDYTNQTTSKHLEEMFLLRCSYSILSMSFDIYNNENNQQGLYQIQGLLI